MTGVRNGKTLIMADNWLFDVDNAVTLFLSLHCLYTLKPPGLRGYWVYRERERVCLYMMHKLEFDRDVA